ncbi:DNA cytosine methyltransferase [Thiobacillus sedimenti]|uniref:DNA (cytosine-5-)-methyltransferase n=1 Tax=Thiobacillus sedimenti TaxID=3110231 RepID=A0ABZ1CM61_9PROT|nr:DNA cytosine methyltransferase [Thiobacillus sp. SCUT-2]WRS40015.1 DNA cytosine methyltransferase [Thiobacillus sp. SCUT-2]
MMKCVELFAGAGGLAMGVGLAGFKPAVVAEWDRWACDTIRENSKRAYPLVADWNVYEGDVREFDWESAGADIDLVAGGPPCQPFSMGGKHKAHDDNRDMFPSTVDVVRRLRPRAFIVENVKGLTRSTFANYYQYILLQLTFPEIVRRKREDWLDHFRRLQREKASGKAVGKGLTYNVLPTLVNAADYGVPQRRERVFIVGFRSDLGVEWSFPRATHSLDALLYDQWVTGEYWRRHGMRAPAMPEKYAARVRRLASDPAAPDTLPWRTVRDALIGLPNPEKRSNRHIPDHRFQPGARTYPGHTGSPFDMPAKTLKAGDHGVPGGENMLVKDDGSVRYFTIRESARLQTFPDGYRFHGSWTETMRQLGNAVPVMLARTVASSVAERLILAQARDLAREIQRARNVA